MTLHLAKPERSLSQIKTLAASGSSSFAKRAQKELQSRMHQQLAKEIRRA